MIDKDKARQKSNFNVGGLKSSGSRMRPLRSPIGTMSSSAKSLDQMRQRQYSRPYFVTLPVTLSVNSPSIHHVMMGISLHVHGSHRNLHELADNILGAR